MPRKTETLNQSIDAITSIYGCGNTGEAMDKTSIVIAGALISISERLYEIEKHLAAMAYPFY